MGIPRNHLDFSFGVYVGGVCRCTVVVYMLALFIILLRIWDVSRTKSMYISTASLQELKEPGKYESFFRVYHNNETDL